MMLTPYTVIPSTPPLSNLIDWGALVNPTVVDPKMRLPGVTVALTIVPVPDNATVWGLLLA